MASSVGGNLDLIESGPCKLSFDGNAVGHTMGGVSFTVKPDMRKREVDEYGTHTADLVYQGEDITVKATLAQKTMQVIQVVFLYGYAYSGSIRSWGRLPGLRASSVAKQLLIHPLSAGAATTHDVLLWKACVSDADEIQFGVITADRTFGVTFQALVDETRGDGSLLGYIGAPV